MIVDCAHYKDGHRSDDAPMSLEEAAARRDEGGFVWLGLFHNFLDRLLRDLGVMGVLRVGVHSPVNARDRADRVWADR